MSRVYVLDRDTLATVGLIEQSFTELAYTRRYQAMDTVALTINRKRLYATELQKGRLLYLPDDGDRVFLIEQVETLQSGERSKDTMTVTGRSLEGIALKERVVVPPAGLAYDSQSAVPAETAIKHYVEKHAVDADDPDRNIPNLAIAADAATGATVSAAGRYQTVLDMLTDLGLLSGLGWEIVLDTSAGEFVFDILTGTDRSDSVFFDFAFETLEKWDEVDSDLDTKSAVVVAGQGEGVDRDIVVRPASPPAGFDRREGFLDARDVEQGNTDLLEARGDAALAASSSAVSLEATVHQFGSFRYLRDWDLGDIVLVRNEERGLEYAARIVEVEVTIRESQAPTVVATLGRPFPTLQGRSSASSSTGTADSAGSVIAPQDEIILDFANQDLRLRRTGAKSMTLDDNAGGAADLHVSGDLYVGDDLDLADDMTLASGSVLTWATDTNLYRSAADTLKTDDDLVVGGGTVTLSTDVRLDRSGAKTLTIDDGAGGLLTNIAVVGAAPITFGTDVKINRGAAGELYLQPAGSGVNAIARAVGASSGDYGAFIGQASGDTSGRAVFGHMGDIDKSGWALGPGNAARDIFAYRSAAKTLKVDTDGAGADLTEIDLETDLLTVAGQVAAETIRLSDTTDVSLSSTGHALQIGSTGSTNIAMDNNEIMARNNGAASDLNLNTDGGKVILAQNASPTTAADGLQFGGDVSLYRSAANVLTTDDVFQALGGISSSGPVHTTTSFTVANGGTATFSSKSLTWQQIGPWVFVRMSFSVTANGSGASTVTLTSTTLPQASGTPRIIGDRGGTGVVPIAWRGVNASGELQPTCAAIGTGGLTSVTGADLVNGSSYTMIGCYYTADAWS